MYFLVETVSVYYFNCPNVETSMKFVAKSTDQTKLQDKIRYMFDHAESIWELDIDDCVNGASMEEIEETSEDVEWFDKNWLSITRFFPEISVNREEITYMVVSDENVEEV